MKEALHQLPGVKDVEASHKTQQIVFHLDVDQTSLEEAKEKFDMLGW